MRWIDEDGRLFGRHQSVRRGACRVRDRADPGSLRHLPAVPHARDAHLVGGAGADHQEERRVAGGNRLTAKLKVRGSGLRPMLRASIDGVPSLGFVFEDPNAADVLVGEVPPGAHDLILYDGVQEIARLANRSRSKRWRRRGSPARARW